jgi:hypothetical protein
LLIKIRTSRGLGLSAPLPDQVCQSGTSGASGPACQEWTLEGVRHTAYKRLLTLVHQAEL